MTSRSQLCFFGAFFLTVTTLFIGLGYNARHLKPDVQDFIQHQQGIKPYKVTYVHTHKESI